MDNRQFFDKVKAMRHFQREYFTTRSRIALQRSVALEREFDTEIERVTRLLNIPEPKPQRHPTLFENNG